MFVTKAACFVFLLKLYVSVNGGCNYPFFAVDLCSAVVAKNEPLKEVEAISAAATLFVAHRLAGARSHISSIVRA